MCKKYLEKRTDTLIVLQPNFPTKELIKKSWTYKTRTVSATKQNEPQVTSPLSSFIKHRLEASSSYLWRSLTKNPTDGAPGWLSSVQLLISGL